MTHEYEAALKQQEMGIAYQTITAAMGPSPQLLAFVNYEHVHENNLGLESLDIMGQHQAILGQIEQSADLDLSEESDSDMLQDGILDMFKLGQDIDQLDALHGFVQESGMTKATFGLIKATDLMSSTAMDTIATESLRVQGSDAFTSEAALESIMDTIKEKATAWSAKIVSLVKKMTTISFKDVIGKIDSTFNAVIKKVSDSADFLTKKVKAHPYKSALAAVGMIAGAAAVILFMGQKIQAGNLANNEAIEKIITESEKIWKWHVQDTGFMPNATPGYINPKDGFPLQGEIFHRYEMARRGLRYAGFSPKSVGPTPQIGTWEELGWTKSSIVALSNMIKPLAGQVSHAVSVFAAAATKFAVAGKGVMGLEAVQVPGMSKKQSHQLITSLFWAMYRLVKVHIGGGYHHLASMILRLMGH